ncbi:tetratricopeptide repeat protein 7B isoform X2 [Macrosteles quadrilineatus]|uniref:tetratricopeptide repeat protein 7B isoform X2 n=1 Tax=Macrosteles quadrilineatus TaxID=74068 RepID=UPI0023E24DDB|nr:tetratricopeptide repeat protein 7B isoform X2 [Macrosteles quadrilineatus]
MAGKGRNSVRIETEIEKSREESNWKKVIELAEQLKSKNAAQAPLCNFLLGEGKLELFLEEWPPVETNFSRARSGLGEAKRCLLNAASEQGKKAGVALDSHLLLGKLHYAMGFFEESLNHYNEADLQSLTEKPLPSRSLRIVAESYAIKGLCLEKVPPSSTSKYKQVEWEEQMARCFELAGDLTLLYLQEQDKVQQQLVTTGTINNTAGSHSPQPQDSTRTMGPILETAIQRAPLLYIQTGKIPLAVTRYRNMLCAVESSGTHGLRLTLTRQLAEVLLRGYTGIRYSPPGNSTKKNAAVSAWKPRLYTGINLFIPRNEYEEVILLLLISEAMAVREAVLSQSPEFKEARIRAMSNAMVIYDLLTITLVRWGQVSLLYECIERAMKFSYEEAHIWLQQALCLESMGHHVHALSALKEVARLMPTKVMPCLIAARICYQHLNLMSEGMQWSQKALARQTSHPQNLLSRCHLYIGIGAHYAAVLSHLKQEKQRLHALAHDSFLKSQQNDPGDHLVEYYLGLHCASKAQVAEALTHTKAALQLCPEHVPSLQLMVLLLTAQKQLTEAHALLDSALLDFPDNLNLLYVKTHLQLQMHGPEVALVSAKQMLTLWKVLYEEQVQQTQNDYSDTRSHFQLYTSEMSDKDTASLHAHSLAASRVEQALSEVASSISSLAPRPGPQRAWLLQLQVWLLIAEIYLSLDQVSAAAASIAEATSIFPLSHHIMYTRGLVHEHKREFMEAKQCFQNAVAINPSHIKSLQHLGLMYHYLGSHRLAEKTLRDAAKIDPHAPSTWYNLGKVLETLGDCQRASDCMATALQVETVSPILPYSSIPITFE